MRELLTAFILLLILFGVAVHSCTTPTERQKVIQDLVSRPLTIPAPPEQLDMPDDIAPGMDYTGVHFSGTFEGRTVAIVPYDSPSTARPWEVIFAFPVKTGSRYLLLSSRLEPTEVLPGFTLVGPTEWVLPIDPLTVPIGYDWLQQRPFDDRLVTYGRWSFTSEWAGSEWWAQVLWWDGGETICLSTGWWFRVGNV